MDHVFNASLTCHVVWVFLDEQGSLVDIESCKLKVHFTLLLAQSRPNDAATQGIEPHMGNPQRLVGYHGPKTL